MNKIYPYTSLFSTKEGKELKAIILLSEESLPKEIFQDHPSFLTEKTARTIEVIKKILQSKSAEPKVLFNAIVISSEKSSFLKKKNGHYFTYQELKNANVHFATTGVIEADSALENIPYILSQFFNLDGRPMILEHDVIDGFLTLKERHEAIETLV